VDFFVGAVREPPGKPITNHIRQTAFSNVFEGGSYHPSAISGTNRPYNDMGKLFSINSS
jgi:hypothetical protein